MYLTVNAMVEGSTTLGKYFNILALARQTAALSYAPKCNKTQIQDEPDVLILGSVY